MERCSVYLRKNSVYIAPVSFTEFGVPMACPLNKIETLDPLEIGNAIVAALNTVKMGIPHPQPDEMKQLEKELYRFIGVNSWAELVKTTSYVCVERQASVTKIFAHKNKRGYGFEECGLVISCVSADAEKIGHGVLKALNLQKGE